MMDGEKHLIPPTESENINGNSRYRWVNLMIFSVLSLLQSGVWDTWGPISLSATEVIGFTEHDYYLLSNWAPIAIMPTMPFFIWLFNKYGARIPVVIASFFVALGTGIRCLPVQGQSRIIAIHIGQFLNAVAGCAVLGAGPLISNTWFPSGERILATSIMICVGNMGNALSYLVGPAIVNPPTNCSSSHNATFETTSSSILGLGSVATFSVGSTTACYDNADKMKKQINYYMYGEFALGFLTLLSAAFLFRNKPERPPSFSAAEERLHILDGLRQLSRNSSFWMCSVAYALVNGAYYGWYGIITILLTPYHVSEKDISQAAFIMTMVGSVLGIAVGWFSDRLKGRIKWILFACYCLMFVSFFMLAIIVMGWFDILKFSQGGFVACFIILGTFSNIIQPLGLELSADLAYPVNEGVSTSIVTWLIMFFMFIFLLILDAIPTTDRNVANYLFLAFVGLAAPILAISAKNENVRVTVDTQKNNRDVSIENDSEPPNA